MRLGWTKCADCTKSAMEDAVTRELQHVPLEGDCVERRVVTDAVTS